MRDVPAEDLSLKAQLTAIDRAIAKTRKFQAESDRLQVEGRRLLAEQIKFGSEHLKLQVKEAKLRRDRWLAPWFLGASLVGGLIVAVINHLWK